MNTIQTTETQHGRIISQGIGPSRSRHHDGLRETAEDLMVALGFRAPPVQDGDGFQLVRD